MSTNKGHVSARPAARSRPLRPYPAEQRQRRPLDASSEGAATWSTWANATTDGRLMPPSSARGTAAVLESGAVIEHLDGAS
jgi:hypothetical protein